MIRYCDWPLHGADEHGPRCNAMAGPNDSLCHIHRYTVERGLVGLESLLRGAA